MFLLVLLFFQPVVPSVTDTLDEVMITANRHAVESSEASVQLVSLSQFANVMLAGESAGQMLNMQTGIVGRSYGRGLSNVQSARGLGARHTQIIYNGVKMNNSMLGVFDINLIPMWFIESAWTRQGAGSSNNGQNAAGGTIALGNSFSNSFAATFGKGAFGQEFVGLKTGFQNSNLSTSIKLFAQRSDNDFEYFNNFYRENRRREYNAQTQLAGEIRNIIQHSDASTEIQLLALSSENEIPVASSLPESSQNQNDVIINTKLIHRRLNSDFNGVFGLTHQMYRLDYAQEFPPIDSRSKTHIAEFFNSSDIALDAFTILLRPSFGYATVETNNYENRPNRIQASFAAYSLYKNNLLRLYADSRVDYLSDFGELWSVSLGTNIQIVEGLNLKSQISHNQNAPTFNDLYWAQGGNPELIPEKINALEIGVHSQNVIMDGLTIESTYFNNRQSDGIYWSPNGGLFSPENIEQIKAYGLNSRFQIRQQIRSLLADISFSHTFTRAFISKERFPDDASVGKQLRYLPEHSFSGSVMFFLNRHFVQFNLRSWSEQFVSNDHASRFDPMMGETILDARIGINLAHKLGTTTFQASIENLTDTRYQSILWYPQAGRSLLFSFTLNLDPQW